MLDAERKNGRVAIDHDVGAEPQKGKMQVTRDQKSERKYLDRIKSWLQKRPRSKDKWHVSDLLYPRKTFWRTRKPMPMTDDEALYFSAGHGHHNFLEAILGPRKKAERSDAGEFEKHNILFSPDLRFTDGPLEIKTSRAKYIKADTEDPKTVYEGYLKQEGSYQGLMDAPKGKLLVLFLNALKAGEKWKTRPQIRVYQVKMDGPERKKVVKWLVGRSKQLTAALKKKSCTELALCPQWLCRDCLYFKACKPWLVDAGRKHAQDKR